ncbi:MAG: AtpZ/AtpI family protein [Acidobacteriota bacterium]|nr:AtpZ/AtpI family protein [Acidobacteriota bacterium]
MAEPGKQQDEQNPGNGSEQTGKGSGGALGELVKAESMIQLAIALPAGCVIGWVLGSWLDGRLHQHWIGITGILLGAVAGFVQIFTTAARYLKRDGR